MKIFNEIFQILFLYTLGQSGNNGLFFTHLYNSHFKSSLT